MNLRPYQQQLITDIRLQYQLGHRQVLAVLPALVQTHQRLTQTSLKLFRWLRCHFFSELPLVELVAALRSSYAFL